MLITATGDRQGSARVKVHFNDAPALGRYVGANTSYNAHTVCVRLL